MRITSTELADYIEILLKNRGDTMSHMCDTIGIPRGTFSMWKTKDYDPRLSNVVKIANYLNISFEQLLNIPQKEVSQQHLPDDIADMVFMLGYIDAADRKMIRLTIKNYYDAALEK